MNHIHFGAVVFKLILFLFLFYNLFASRTIGLEKIYNWDRFQSTFSLKTFIYILFKFSNFYNVINI